MHSTRFGRIVLVNFSVVLAMCSIAGCEVDSQTGELVSVTTAPLPRGGDAVRGRDLLLNNGTENTPYLSCGLPRGVVTIASWFGIDMIGTGPTLPERKRGMASLPYDVSLAKRPSGVEVVTTNCLICHASKLGGSVVIGLGNANADFTQDQSVFGLAPIALDVVSVFLTPAENAELARFRRVTEAESLFQRPDTKGMNPADVLFGVLAAHRDEDTLQWLDEPKPDANLDLNLLYTDVPAWWNLHQKGDRMFYSGFGRGSHARIMMTAALMCLEDTTEAAAIDAYFGDIEAFILSLRPPRYVDVAKRAIDATRADRGRTVYMATCSGCHGDSKNNVPPIPSVPASVVGTDDAYASSASLQGDGALAYYFDFFNNSWMGTHGDAGMLVREQTPQYAPPPLVGIWATAPYFHNGSVPTLDAVLDPSLRPTIFRRSFKPEEYDFERLGWPYQSVLWKGSDVTVYDTRRWGYRNTGHTFAAGLTSTQRRDLLEYLKTL
jgi:mono/diheme cytochrome c family protein